MTGISVGWFDPVTLHPDTAALSRAMKKLMAVRLRRTRGWPFAVQSIRWQHEDVGVAYAVIDGPVPLHIDELGLTTNDGQVFHFVIEVENRPAFVTAGRDTRYGEVLSGITPPTEPLSFGLGGFELKVGQAVHFDITQTYHGVIGLPVPRESTYSDVTPRAVVIQVGGFPREDIESALLKAAHWIQTDESASSGRL